MYKINKYNGNFNMIGSKIKEIRKQNKIKSRKRLYAQDFKY